MESTGYQAPAPGYSIGVDLGGAKTEAIVLDPCGRTVFRQRVATPSHAYGQILDSIAELLARAAAAVPEAAGASIGIGIPGSIKAQTGLVQNANTTCLIGRPLKNDLEAALGRTIAVENDANCFTLAECRAGAGQGFDLVFGIIMGTGCGGGMCINGHVRQGPHRIAGEWGHYAVDPQGAACYCGKKGCVETKISGGGVEAAFSARYGRVLSMRDIVQGYRSGDSACMEAFTAFLDDFGRCLGGLISILDPDAVVLGGGLSNIDELYTLGFEKVRAYAFHEQVHTPILKNRLGDSAGVFGAAWTGAAAIGNDCLVARALDDNLQVG
ncbi:MAG: ROK family protein [Deltaproteobacteria bacterium]|nr:ROK family protein [Deltaproteobacteria bacterium]